MNDYTERQIADLLELVPELMMHLRNRAEAGDDGARSLFDALDNHCWHQPETCGEGWTCEGGKQQRRPEALKYSPAARELAAYEADIYKAKRNARVAKKGGLR